MLDLCARAGDLGLAGVFAFDHLIPLGDPFRPVLEGATALGAAAARVGAPARIGSLVLRVSLRPPEITSALAATVTMISGGRAVIGLGVGDRFSDQEAQRLGMPSYHLEDRLRQLEQTIEAVRAGAGPCPVWVGGAHPRVREAAIRLADGWNLWGPGREELGRAVGEVRAEAPEGFQVSWGGRVLLAPDRESLDHQIARRGGEEALAASGLVAGTPALVASQLSERATLVDQLVVSVLPNQADSWMLFSSEVLPALP
jgi:alkanesulfonate monooxygenase SsuD/methylene tetrahydromethanopterin reductase-like flavin-dependent oxidoreductase (luciferase family)